MKNSEGFSWPETILSLSIMFIYFDNFATVIKYMHVQLEDKKEKYHASSLCMKLPKSI